MQTKQQIKLLLDSAGIKPKKNLGQNFLIDLNLIRLLLDAARIENNDVILEVGCGTGSLTQEIADRAGCCVAVEIDNTLAQITASQLADNQNTKIINADVLENKSTINPAVITAVADARKKHSGRLMLVANLPYNIASPLIINLIVGPLPADAFFVTVQKEVAQRMTAQPACKDYGIISILLTATGRLKNIRTLKPSVFWPAPKVDSAMISYARDAEKLSQIKSIELLKDIVGSFLQHRRKTLNSSLRLLKGQLEKIADWHEIFAQLDIDPADRPDHLTPQQYIAVANLCYDYLEAEQGKKKC